MPRPTDTPETEDTRATEDADASPEDTGASPGDAGASPGDAADADADASPEDADADASPGDDQATESASDAGDALRARVERAERALEVGDYRRCGEILTELSGDDVELSGDLATRVRTLQRALAPDRVALAIAGIAAVIGIVIFAYYAAQ